MHCLSVLFIKAGSPGAAAGIAVNAPAVGEINKTALRGTDFGAADFAWNAKEKSGISSKKRRCVHYDEKRREIHCEFWHMNYICYLDF